MTRGLNRNFPDPVEEGWMMTLKAGSLIPLWKRRYVILDNVSMRIWLYKNPTDPDEVASYEMRGAELHNPADSTAEIKRSHGILVKTRGEQQGEEVHLWLCAETAFELRKWDKALRGLVSGPHGARPEAGCVFGASLESIAEREKCLVPRIVLDAIEYVRREALLVVGIYRLSGNAAEVQAIRGRYNTGERVDLANVSDPHAVSGALKLFLRELPEPLLTFDFYPSFLAIGRMPEGPDVAVALLMTVSRLPLPNRCLLYELVRHINEVSKHEPINKMGVANLVTVFAPNLLRAREENMATMVADMTVVAHVVQMLIDREMALKEGLPESYDLSADPGQGSRPRGGSASARQLQQQQQQPKQQGGRAMSMFVAPPSKPNFFKPPGSSPSPSSPAAAPAPAPSASSPAAAQSTEQQPSPVAGPPRPTSGPAKNATGSLIPKPRPASQDLQQPAAPPAAPAPAPGQKGPPPPLPSRVGRPTEIAWKGQAKDEGSGDALPSPSLALPPTPMVPSSRATVSGERGHDRPELSPPTTTSGGGAKNSQSLVDPGSPSRPLPAAPSHKVSFAPSPPPKQPEAPQETSQLDGEIELLKKEHEAALAQKDAEIAALRQENASLKADVTRIKSLLASVATM